MVEVDAQTIPLRVAVCKHADLEDRVRANGPAGDEVRGRESGLLDLGEVVEGILVQGDFAEGDEGVVFLRDGFGCVEDVGFVGFCFGGIDDLSVNGPGWVVAFLDRRVEVLGSVIRVLAANCGCLVLGQISYTLVGLEMNPDIFKRSVLSKF